jgi:hypothetical protein
MARVAGSRLSGSVSAAVSSTNTPSTGPSLRAQPPMPSFSLISWLAPARFDRLTASA